MVKVLLALFAVGALLQFVVLAPKGGNLLTVLIPRALSTIAGLVTIALLLAAIPLFFARTPEERKRMVIAAWLIVIVLRVVGALLSRSQDNPGLL